MRKSFITVLSFAFSVGTLIAFILSAAAAWIGPPF